MNGHQVITDSLPAYTAGVVVGYEQACRDSIRDFRAIHLQTMLSE